MNATAENAAVSSGTAEPVRARSGPRPPRAADSAKARRKRPRGRGSPGDRGRGGCRRSGLGRYGEDLAARWLTAQGMRILDRNWRCRLGEIDIVAADADAFVVCEVKTRRAGPYEHPMAAITPTKARRLGLLAEHWTAAHGGPPPGGVRIDVIGVQLPARGAPVVSHVRGVT